MDDASLLEPEVASRARSDGLLAPGDRVLVGASGGADSTATAGLLVAARAHGLPLDVVLGHVDHGWRGRDEAAADRAVVSALADRLGVAARFAGPPADVRRTEDDARRFRYASLAAMALEAGCTVVATGHHLRDQAETFLLRLERGSGPAGLAGIPARRPVAGGRLAVVRPVLDVDPARLRAYAIARGLPWREDPTNAEVDRDRARVRARLAALGDRGAALARDLAGAADRFARALARREREVEARLSPSLRVHPEAGAVEVALCDVAGLPPRATATVLRVLGRAVGADARGPWFTRRHVDLVESLVESGHDGATVPLPHDLDVRRLGRRLLLARRAGPSVPDVGLRPGGRTAAPLEAGTLEVEWTEVGADAFDVHRWARERTADRGDPPWHAAIDAEALGADARLRAIRPEDAFVPLGRTTPTPVHAWLSKQGLPEVLRRGTRVLASGGRILWVVGHRVAADAALSDRTRRVALLTVDVHTPPAALSRP